MPSLPELEVYKHKLAQEMADQPVTQVEPLDFRVVRASTEALNKLLVGHTIARLERYGKWLIASAGAPEQLIIHLGLTGKLRLLAPEDALPKYASFILHFADGQRLVMSDQRHLGKVMARDFVGLKAEKALGPDLLDLPEDYFAAKLGQLYRGVRDVLMDQKLIAGIGGKYADEILWQAKLNPHAKLSTLSPAQLQHLQKLALTITNTAISLGADVERFPANWLIPHRHTDGVCPRCHNPLEANATAFHCPHCQPSS